MRKETFVLQLLLCGLMASAASPPTGNAPIFSVEERNIIATLAPPALPPPPPDRTNKYADDPQAAKLGRQLFFDPRFSGLLLDGDNDGSPVTLGRKGEAGRVACAGCHVPSGGFQDNRTRGHSISLAAGWGRRHAPSLLDVGQARLLMWDGRRDTLHSQIFEALESPLEMNTSRLYVAQQLARFYRADYERVFGTLPRFDDPDSYPQLTAEQTGCRPGSPAPRQPCDGTTSGMPGDEGPYDSLPRERKEAVTRAVVNMGKAIAAYQRRLTCGPSRFDAWANGETGALSVAEQRGLKLFIGKARCISCHSGPYFSDQQFHNVGLIPRVVAVVFRDTVDDGAYGGIRSALSDPLNSRGKFSDGDDGRLPHAPAESLKGAYKTPMLRCVGRRLSFMRTGQIMNLADAIEFFDKGGTRPDLVGRNELVPLGLSADEKSDLLAFLLALDGKGPAAELLGP